MRRIAAALLAAPILLSLAPSAALANEELRVGKSTTFEFNPRSERIYGFRSPDGQEIAVVLYSKSGEFLDVEYVTCDTQHAYFKIEKHQSGGYLKVTCSADKS